MTKRPNKAKGIIVPEPVADDVVGRSFGSNTLATKEEDGSWKVVVSIIEKRLVRDGEWEEKSVDAMCIDNDFQNAYLVAMTTVLKKFDASVVPGTDTLFSGASESK